MKRIQFVIILIFCFAFANAQQFSNYKYNVTNINKENKNVKADTSFSLTHSVSMNIDAGTSVSCNSSGIHYENSYYRVFDLYNYFNLNSDWSIQQVEIGIGLAQSGTGTTQPAEIRLYVMPEYDGSTIIQDSLHLQQSIQFNIDDNETGLLKNIIVDPAVSIPFGKVLITEIFIPDGHDDNHLLFIGSNDEGQTDKTYIRAPECGVENPVDIGTIGYEDMCLVMTITGAYNAAVPEILSFQIEGQLSTTEIINEPDYEINVVMPADTLLTSLAPEISIPVGFNITPQSGEIIDFSAGPVEYVVTNENSKVIQSWFANVTNAGPDIVFVTVSNQIGETIIDSENHQINVSVPTGTDLTNISPVITIYEDFIISPESGTSQDFSSGSVTYTVSHETLPLTQDWEVIVTESEPTDINLIENNYKIFPNPAKDFIQITGLGITKVEILDFSGKSILTSQKSKINISNISDGIYLLKIKTSFGQIIKKISIIK